MQLAQAISKHVERMDHNYKARLAQTFKEHHVAIIDDLLPADLFERMRQDAQRLLRTEARRRELTIRESGNTPRAYTSVGRDAIAADAGVIPAIFQNDAVRDFLSEIAGERLERVPYQPEEYIVNSQSLPGDTHGWHWDDYSYAFIWVLEAPDPLLGGRVEFVPRVEWEKGDTETYLRNVLSKRQTRTAYIQAGQCYLMKTDTTLHRVTPLTGETTRSVAIFTFASPADMLSTKITHTSMEEIYPEVAAA
jgi:hypothetical protein